MTKITRMAVLAVAGLVLSGCELIVSPDRVEEGSGETVTISNDPESPAGLGCGNDEVEAFSVQGDADPVSLGTTTAVDGAWSIDALAPGDRGSYTIFAECDGFAFGYDELIVTPAFAPTATPTQYVTGAGPDVVTVAGDWCITSTRAFGEVEEGPGGLPFPTVTGLLGPDEMTAVATDHQPFAESWELEFTAPTTPGLHQIEITCAYFDYESGADTTPVGVILSGGEVESLGEPELELPAFITAETVTSLVPVQVDGVLETDGLSFTVGDSVTVANAASSPCDGVVTVRLTDGDTTVSRTPDVADDGTWTASFDDLALGDPTVDASCEGTEEAGTFSYEPVVLSVAAGATTTTATTTTTTTAPPAGKVAAASAAPVAAEPGFTG